MIMKRFLCILLSASYLLVSYALSEKDNTIISFAVMNDGDRISFTTSLLPNNTLTVIHPEAVDSDCLFSLIEPETFPDLVSCFNGLIQDRNAEMATIQNGCYVGDLFESACEKQYLELNEKDIEPLCNDLVERFRSGTDSGLNKESDIEYVLKLFAAQLFNQETTACISTFDRQYITIEIVRRLETLFTISADLRAKDSYRVVIGRRAGDMVYYEEITCRRSNDETDYFYSLYRTEAPSFRMVSEEDCIQFAEFRCMDDKDDRFSFDGEIESVLLSSTAKITGGSMTGNDKRNIVYAEMEIEEQAQGIIDTIIPALYSVLQP